MKYGGIDVGNTSGRCRRNRYMYISIELEVSTEYTNLQLKWWYGFDDLSMFFVFVSTLNESAAGHCLL